MQHTPQYSLDSFHELLAFRRVTVEPKKRALEFGRNTSHGLARNSLLAGIQEQINERLEEGSNDSDVDAAERFLIPDLCNNNTNRRADLNPDFFYNPLRDLESGTKYRYIGANDVLGDRRYSNNTDTASRCNERVFLESIRDNKTAIEIWEQNDELTLSETAVVPVHDVSDPYISNGGVYLPYRPEFYSLSSHDPMHLLELPPAEKFRDLLRLEGKFSVHLDGIDESRKGKGNLSSIIAGGPGPDLLAVAHMSQILIYEFEETSNGIKPTPSLIFETRPNFTSDEHVRNLTWPFYPHTLNCLKSHGEWVNGPILSACADDGRILIWDKSDILGAMAKQRASPVTKLQAKYQAKVKSSAWGIDFVTNSTSDEEHYVMCASANTETVSIFYFQTHTLEFTSVESHKLSHNIPEVSIISYLVENENHLVLLSCTTIQEELVVWKIPFKLEVPSRSKRANVTFGPPEVVRRSEIGGDGWTSKPIHCKYFKKVQSLRALTGDPNINELNEAATILCESKILEVEQKNILSLNFGIASYWQYFEPPMIHLASAPPDMETNPKPQCVNEEHQRIQQAYKLLCTKEEDKDPVHKGLEDVFLAVSTERKLCLYRADTLFCAAATRDAFTLKIPCDEETLWCDRISLTHVIPELSCFVAVTQIGLVTIMRLCEYRGVYGMRQEHLFPHALNLGGDENRKRTFIGFNLRNLSVLAEHPRFFLYFIYSDGFTLTYQLCTRSDNELEISEI